MLALAILTAVTASPWPVPAVPPLEAGDRLTRDEFHRRYLLHPEIKKAELIEGVVYVPSPVSYHHSGPHALASAWLTLYAARHPIFDVHDNLTVRVEGENEVQPDVLLRRIEGGSSLLGTDGYLHGPPELAFEVSASSVTYDVHVKKDLYRRIGVREYLVWRIFDRAIDWFLLQDGAYRVVQPGRDGFIESPYLAGLRLHVQAMLDGNRARVLAGAS